MDKTIKERTLDFIKYMEISVKEFEIRCNLSNGYVAAMRKGFGSDKLNNVLSEFPDLNRDWLLYGEGPMLKTEEEQGGTMVPLLPVAAAAGSLDGFAASVRLQDCEKVASPIKGVDFVMPVVGDSMEPEYPSGAMLFIKKVNEKLFLEWGKVYVLDTENGSVVKKLMPTEKEGVVECISLNPKYPPFKVDLSCAYGVYRVLLCMMRK